MTAQVHEHLLYDGLETSMACCPPLPLGHPRVVENDPESRRRDEELKGSLGSTACWRRYQGSWEIKDGRLYLIGIRGRYRLIGEEPLFADWFSGVILIPKGEVLHYVHMGFETVYEQEIQVIIEKGMAVHSQVIDNRGKKFDSRR